MSTRSTVAVILVAVLLAYILAVLAIMVVHWRRYRRETDRYRAWQSVFGRRGAKIVLVSLLVAVAALVGLFAALQSAPR